MTGGHRILTLDPEIPPWERQARESKQSYEAFIAYRDMLDLPQFERRSIRGCASLLNKTAGNLMSWSTYHHWQERCAAWDTRILRQRDAARTKAQADTVAEHLKSARALRALANRKMTPPRDLVGQARDDWTPDPKESAAIVALLDSAIRHERLALGLPTDVTKQDVVLRDSVAKALEGQKLLMAIIGEHLCDDCRARVAGEYERVLAHHRALENSLQ